MIGIIRDKKGRFVEQVEGKHKGGTFYYEYNVIKVLGFLKLRAEKDEAPFDYDKCIDFGGKIGKVAVFEYNGDGLTQMSLNDIEQYNDSTDFKKDWKLGEYAEAAVLKRPEDNMMSAVKWLAYIALFIMCAVNIWNSNHTATVIGNAAKNTPAMNISLQNAAILKVCQTSWSENVNSTRATNGYLENISKYLSLTTPK